MAKYYLKCYRTHEDEQYDHSDFLEPKEYSSLESAEKRLKSLYDGRRYYQVMITDEKGCSKVVIRDNRLYYFEDASDLTKLVIGLFDNIILKIKKLKPNTVSSYCDCELIEDMGFIDLKISSGKVSFVLHDIFGNSELYNALGEDVCNVIKAVNRLSSKPVKKVVLNSWYTRGRSDYYCSPSRLERGSVDMHFDFL